MFCKVQKLVFLSRFFCANKKCKNYFHISEAYRKGGSEKIGTALNRNRLAFFYSCFPLILYFIFFFFVMMIWKRNMHKCGDLYLFSFFFFYFTVHASYNFLLLYNNFRRVINIKKIVNMYFSTHLIRKFPVGLCPSSSPP